MKQIHQKRQFEFERWFVEHVENAKRQRYFQEMARTTVERLNRADNPQALPDRTPVVQNIDLDLYPIETVYEFSSPEQLIPLWTDCSRERFGDDGSLKAAIAYYMMWWRLKNPFRWRGIDLIAGDQGRIRGMSEKKNYDYLKEMEERMKMTKSWQMISYGAPGTGKSFFYTRELNDNEVIRTTFHPDSDYSSFVGAYKPTMEQTVEGRRIVYDFVAQAFVKAYVDAWKFKINQTRELGCKPVFLIVEEINRGNCAQVFGDLFQLLDRGDSGFSVYPINPDRDLQMYLQKEFHGLEFRDKSEKERINELFEGEDIVASILNGGRLVLPDNLYIWATMNTSDQSLFPMDSAFKRRWDWKYVPISKPDKSGDANWKERKVQVGDALYDWWDFVTIINSHISSTTKSEDKQLGYFFVKAPDDTGIITEEQFVNKVLFYLYNDVFKDYDYPSNVFGKGGAGKEKYSFQEFFHLEKEGEKKPGDVKSVVLQAFLDTLKFGDKGIAKSQVPVPPPAPAPEPAAAPQE